MVKFPELKIISEVDEKRTHVMNLLVQLDWTEIDNLKIIQRKNWWRRWGLGSQKVTKEEKEVVDILLDEADWSEFNYPKKYDHIFQKYQTFKMSKDYYNECLYLKEKALEEWNRQKPFDTEVREKLLEVGQKFVSLYFYMIIDCIWMTQIEKTEDSPFEILTLLRSLLLFRFWKWQTGGGLVVDRSSDFIRNDKKVFDETIKPDLINNMNTNIFDISSDTLDREEEFKKLVKSKLRELKINKII